MEIVTDYLTPESSEKLLAAYNMSTADLNGSKASSSAAAAGKRKADWEQELEVGFIALALFCVNTKRVPGVVLRSCDNFRIAILLRPWYDTCFRHIDLPSTGNLLMLLLLLRAV